jgi:GH15 family glucan-1,4-alpha-glucosidase
MNLRDQSIKIINENQASTGAYVASPNFPTYAYSWLRDGSFIAYGMLVQGETESAKAFLNWVHETLMKHQEKIQEIVIGMETGKTFAPEELLPTRYTMDGEIEEDDWPNFQIDGYGAWLWLLAEYIQETGDEYLLVQFQQSVRMTIDYIKLLWDKPNYDCWEEFGDRVHGSTLACLYGGINSINRYLGEVELLQLAAEMKVYVEDNLVASGHFMKNNIDDSVDSSLLWLAYPFEMFGVNEERMKNTIAKIEEDLLDAGGVKRYLADTYYGGGQWLILSSWLGIVNMKQGKRDKAKGILDWVEAQAGEIGMPEQVSGIVNDPSHVTPWVEKWGPVADPLIWSHGMYLTFLKEMERK